MMKHLPGIILALLLGVSTMQPVLADDSHHTDSLTAGEIRKVDKDARKVTIKHGEIKNLGMPAMTMVFQVPDPGLLEQLKAGDKVNFRAEKIGGAYTITKIEPVK
jgi:Cu(I)/Ag(I) efflux system protein CusF